MAEETQKEKDLAWGMSQVTFPGGVEVRMQGDIKFNL